MQILFNFVGLRYVSRVSSVDCKEEEEEEEETSSRSPNQISNLQTF
jgi:hypothetical protein